MSPSIGTTFFVFIFLSLVFIVIERVFGKSRGRPMMRRGWWVDTAYFFFSPLVMKVISKTVSLLPFVFLVLIGVVTADGLKNRDYTGFGPLSQQPIWLQMLEIYLISDLISYWTHRLFHRDPWWPFHAVHHSSEQLDWLSSVRVHPVNDIVNALARTLPLVLLGFNPFATLSVTPFLTFYAIFIHANVDWTFGPLKYVIATPAFHRWHHSKDKDAMDKNFAGLFPFFDILFGTFYMPKGRAPENFGIHGEMPNHFVGQMLQPFRSKK